MKSHQPPWPPARPAFRREIAVLAHREDLRHLDVVEAPAFLRQGVQQGGRFAHTGRDDDHVAVAHVVEGIEGAAAFGAIHLLRGLHGCLLCRFCVKNMHRGSLTAWSRKLTRT
jgi:hypothetical protein